MMQWSQTLTLNDIINTEYFMSLLLLGSLQCTHYNLLFLNQESSDDPATAVEEQQLLLE